MFIIQLFNSLGCSLKLQESSMLAHLEETNPEIAVQTAQQMVQEILPTCRRQLSLWESYNSVLKLMS